MINPISNLGEKKVIEHIYFDGREFHSEGKLDGQTYKETAIEQEGLLFMAIQKLNEVIEYINGKEKLADKGKK